MVYIIGFQISELRCLPISSINNNILENVSLNKSLLEIPVRYHWVGSYLKKIYIFLKIFYIYIVLYYVNYIEH